MSQQEMTMQIERVGAEGASQDARGEADCVAPHDAHAFAEAVSPGVV